MGARERGCMSDDGHGAQSGSLTADSGPEQVHSAPEVPEPPAPRGIRGLRDRFPRTSGYLLRSLLLAAATIIILALIATIMTAWSVINTVQRYDDSDGYSVTGGDGAATWSSVVGYSAAGQWYDLLGSLGGLLPAAVLVTLVLAQPLMEFGWRRTRSWGLGSLLGLVPIAAVGIVVCVVIALSLSRSGGTTEYDAGLAVWTGLGTGVWIAVVYGIPILLIAATVMGLSRLADRRRMRPIVLGAASVIVVAVIIGSIGLFRPPPPEVAADQQISSSIDRFTNELDGLGGIADIDVLGSGATITMAFDAEETDVLEVAMAARDAAEAQTQPDIVIVVLQREPEPGTAAALADPPAVPWRFQLVPTDLPVDDLPDQVERLIASETLGVQVVVTQERPAITVPSIAALPEAVRLLSGLYPAGALLAAPERFSMVLDPEELSPAMVDSILTVVAAFPDAEFEVTEQPKLYVNHIAPDGAAAIVAMLQDPALAGTSPSGYPAEYQIRTSGPDGEVFLDGTFG